MSSDSEEGYETTVQPGSLRADTAIAALGKQAVEILSEEEQITVEEAAKKLEAKGETKNETWMHHVYEVMAHQGLIDRDGTGPIYNANNNTYSLNGHTEEELIDYVESYNAHSEL